MSEADVETLYQLPLDEFTAARNELAKRLAKEGDGETAAEVRKLAKPTVPAWAVNQLVRREPKLLERLLRSGEELQEQVLRGQGGAEALRRAQQDERETVRELVEHAEGLLNEAGRPATAQTLERISGTLTAGAQTDEGRESLRSGTLTAELEPAGFEALAGLTPRKPAPRKPSARDELAEARRAKQERERERRRLSDELRKLERRAAAAEREAEEAREAAQQARRDADEAARALAELDV